MAAVNQTRLRRYERVPLPHGMLVAWQAGGRRVVSRVGTLGLGGIFITTPQPPPSGTVMKLLFELPGGDVRARAIVCSSHPGKGMGVKFVSMGYEDRGRLNQLLRRLLGKSPERDEQAPESG